MAKHIFPSRRRPASVLRQPEPLLLPTQRRTEIPKSLYITAALPPQCQIFNHPQTDDRPRVTIHTRLSFRFDTNTTPRLSSSPPPLRHESDAMLRPSSAFEIFHYLRRRSLSSHPPEWLLHIMFHAMRDAKHLKRLVGNETRTRTEEHSANGGRRNSVCVLKWWGGRREIVE